MLKISTTLVTIYAIVMTFMAIPALAQPTATGTTQNGAVPATTEPVTAAKKEPDFKKLLVDDTTKLGTEPVAFDPKKADAIHSKQQTKKGWSTQKKLWITAAIIGAAGLLFVLIKYGKECLRTNPANCTLGSDEICTCEEYERRIPK